MHYLKLVADQVFGINHFIGTLPRRTRNGKSDVPFNFLKILIGFSFIQM